MHIYFVLEREMKHGIAFYSHRSMLLTIWDVDVLPTTFQVDYRFQKLQHKNTFFCERLQQFGKRGIVINHGNSEMQIFVFRSSGGSHKLLSGEPDHWLLRSSVSFRIRRRAAAEVHLGSFRPANWNSPDKCNRQTTRVQGEWRSTTPTNKYSENKVKQDFFVKHKKFHVPFLK